MRYPASFSWTWQDRVIEIGYDRFGSGPILLLLPAFSTVSSRVEMRPLAEFLAADFDIVVPDWPGFGASSIRLAHAPALHLAFLRDFAACIGATQVVAAGHAAGYVLALGGWSRLVLIAPTWRGPLPTMMGGYRKAAERVRRAIEWPLLGPALYRVNVSGPVIRAMYRRHVFADPARLTGDFIAGKVRIARRRGGRFGAGAFVTGALDPMRDRAAFLSAAGQASGPVFVIYGADTPPRSLAEMEALARLPGVISKCLASGALGLHEENPVAVASLIRPFLLNGHRGQAGGMVSFKPQL